MDDIKERIKEYVLLIKSDLTDNDLLDFTVEEVCDRVLAYTNRYQLIDQYEEDLVDTTVEAEDYEIPIPPELERVVARAIVGAYQSNEAQLDNELAVSSATDNGQQVSYSGVTSYLQTSDEELFRGNITVLNRFRVPSVPETGDDINYSLLED